MKEVILFILLLSLTYDCSHHSEEDNRAYCIDFNWHESGPNGFAPPGLWADASPAEHIQWYKELGCDIIQTFAVSCNGYAWYKSEIVPGQPGLKYDFLTDMVKLGHKEGMKVYGYFCAGSNTRWGADNPQMSYGTPAAPHIPFTNQYIDFLCASIKDAIERTSMDGYLLDWVWTPAGMSKPFKPLAWLPCEQQMYQELMGEVFPGTENITAEIETEFRRRSIERLWERVYKTTKESDPDCKIFLSCCDVNSFELKGSKMFKQADIFMNERGDIEGVEEIKDELGENSRLFTCLALWNGQNPDSVIPHAQKLGIGLYGFTKPTVGSLKLPISDYLSKPLSEFKGDDYSIAYFARIFNGHDKEYVKRN